MKFFRIDKNKKTAAREDEWRVGESHLEDGVWKNNTIV